MTRNSQQLHPVWEKLLFVIQPPRLITLVGGGGKTSLMYYLAGGLKAQGRAALAATTTKLFPPAGPDGLAVLLPSLGAARQAVVGWRDKPQIVTLAREEESSREKLAGLDPGWLDALAAEFSDVTFIIEGDGTAGRSLKGHLAYEPVVPASTRLLVPVVGVDVLGQQLAANYVHRPERAAELAGSVPGEAVTEAMVVKLLLHPEGYLHNCPPGTAVIPFINKAEGNQARRTAAKLAQAIMTARHPAVAGVVTGSVRENDFSFFEI